MQFIKCIRCWTEKDRGAFIEDPTSEALRGVCGSCRIAMRMQRSPVAYAYDKYKVRRKARTRYRRVKKYKLSLTEYHELLVAQQFECFGCKEKFEAEDTKRAPCIDHCHQTGKVRGLLCGRCNTALGMVKDSVECLINLINYLQYPPFIDVQKSLIEKNKKKVG